MSSIVAGEAPIINLDEDLEDGEIDDDDEEEEEQKQQQQQQQKQQQQKSTANNNNTGADDVQFLGIERKPDKLSLPPDDDVVFLGIAGGAGEPATGGSGNKSKKPRPLEGKTTT